jgi:lysozyme
MNSMRAVNELGIKLIKMFEGCRLMAYRCQAGRWTIGYGSTAGVYQGMRIDMDMADQMFRFDLSRHSFGVERVIKVPLDDNQFAACVSLAYNIGVDAFANSTLLKLLNLGRLQAASEQFKQWRYVKGEVSQGLAKRRDAERLLFLSKVADLDIP